MKSHKIEFMSLDRAVKVYILGSGIQDTIEKFFLWKANGNYDIFDVLRDP